MYLANLESQKVYFICQNISWVTIDKINHQNDICDVPVCLQLGQGRITTQVGRPPGTVPAGP